MSDNVQVASGQGITVETKNVNGVHRQQFGVPDGADVALGSTADDANDLTALGRLAAIRADLATLQAGIDALLTDAELRAAPVAVSGPLTDAELRATAVPVSGPLTDAALRAAPVPVESTLDDVYAALKLIANLLTRPIAQEQSTGRLRVAVETHAGTLPAVTTVTTVTSLTQLAGFSAKDSLLASADRASWALCLRNRIT